LNIANALMNMRAALSDPHGDAPVEKPLPDDLIHQLRDVHKIGSG